MDETTEIINTNPRERANFLSVLFFTYTASLFRKGYKKDLDIDDLYNPLKSDRCSKLGDRLESKWKAHLEETRHTGKPSLLKVLTRTYWPEFLFLGILLAFAQLVLRILYPIMLGELLDYFTPNTSKTKQDALIYAAVLVASNAGIALVVNQYMLEGCHTGVKIRSSCCTLVYRKALKLSKTSLSKLVTGKVVNLLSTDVSRFEVCAFLLHYLWVTPCAAIIVTILLYQKAGFVGVVGVIPACLIIPLQGYTGKLASTFRKKTSLKTDERIRLMDEIIAGVQVIKMYAWEKPFEKLIKFARMEELQIIRKFSYIRALFMTFSVTTTKVAILSALLTVVLTNQELSAGKMFVLVCYYDIIANVLSALFIRAVTEVAETLTSIRRIQDFLLLDEHEHFEINRNTNVDLAVGVTKLTAQWTLNCKENALSNVNLKINKGSLVGIIGPVGSGKSAFLQTLLGELCISSGEIEGNGSFSYASQDVWTFAATIRQNILFGQKYSKERYEKVLHACALEKDLDQFPDGDLSIIGDNGASLSGGQKGRINLARAVYREADIYLLDDPLSAVDAAVAKHIYQKCINGFLANKTRVLVTHQVYHLKNATKIYIFNKGSIEIEGKFDELASSKHFYAETLMKDPESIDELHFSQNDLNEKSNSEMSLNGKEVLLEKVMEVEMVIDKSKDFKEKSSKGAVPGSLLLKYLSAGSNYGVVFFLMASFLLVQVFVSLSDYYIKYWVTQEEYISNNYSSNHYLQVYAGIIAGLFLTIIFRSYLFYYFAIKSSQSLHDKMFACVVNTNMNFFDNNPRGRILNRFSKDISSIDEFLPRALLDAAQILLLMAGSIVLVVIVRPYFILPIIIIGFIFAFMRKVYLKSSKNVKRVEGICRSPVFSHLNSTLQGLTIIRAYKSQGIVTSEFEKYQDSYTSASYMFFSLSYAFGFTLDFFSSVFTAIVTFSFLLIGDSTGGDVGLAITQAATLTGILNWGLRQSAETVNQLIAVERVLEYTLLPLEKQPVIQSRLNQNWPENGEIVFKNLGLRYGKNKPLTLKKLNGIFNATEKIGIVGRTGAGKSSIITALMSLAIVEGDIEIDGISTREVDLKTLRSKISIIPQDPVLFSGTLRYNLDPFGEYPDDVLYNALKEVELNDDSNTINNLEYKVLAQGSNYSVGQRQLICLARALIRKNRILLLDEATANVDPQTDTIIQKTIREKFLNCTVLTIAHRLNTIIDSDRVLVMDNGRIVEFDHPHLLLENKDGAFYKMVLKTEKNTIEQLILSAERSYFQKSGLVAQ